MTEPINILYVDDYPLDRELVRDTLEKEDGGFEVVEAASRAEFETRLAEGDYDLVLSDFNILGFEGLQVIDTVRTEKGPLPVVILTGTGSEEVAVEAMKRGAADYVVKKPHHIQRLPLTLRAVLNRVRAEEALKEQFSTLRSIIDSVDALIFSVDRQYCYTSFNQGHAAVMKALYGAEIEIGRSLLDYMTVTEDRETARGNLDRALAGEQLVEEAFSGEELHSRRYFRVSHSPIKNEAGQVIGVAVLAQDMTERKQAEQSIALMSFALDNVHEAAFLIDENARFHYINEEACRILGYTRDELLNLSVAEVDPDFPAERWPNHWDELKTHRSLIFESRHKTKDGRLIPVEVNANYFEYDGQGYNLALVRDITGRKKTEQERLVHLGFLECMDQINRAIQGTNDLEQMMSDVLDLVLSTLECDRAFLMYPCDPEAATWRVPMERNKPEYPGAQELGLEMPMDPDVAETLRLLLDADGPVKFGPGTSHPLPADVAEQFGFKCFMSMALHPKVGKPWQFGIHQCSYARIWTAEEERLFQEIGRRLADGLSTLLAYRDLQESENRYRRITEGLTDYQYSVRVEDGRAVETTQSQACETVTGYTSEEFAADPYLWFHMIAPEDRNLVQERIQQVLAGKEIPPLEHRLIRKDGAVRWVRDTTILLKDASGKLLGYDGVIKDITRRRQAEEEIRQLNQDLEQRVSERTAQLKAANKELEAFAHSVSHDLRAPLRRIDGFLELLQERLAANLDDRSRHYMATISNSAKHMGQLIDDLLAFSRMGRYELSKTPVDLAGLMQEIIREFEPEIQDRTINWHIADLPTVSGDRAMLRLALVNLISNALKFTRGRPQVDIEIGCQAGEKETTIFIRDNGVGFDMTYVDRLFGVFQRLHLAEEFEGTGIGLANVRRIINRHGGRTWAEGETDRGATFYFSLPTLNQGV